MSNLSREDHLKIIVNRQWNVLNRFIIEENWPSDFLAKVVELEELTGQEFDYETGVLFPKEGNEE